MRITSYVILVFSCLGLVSCSGTRRTERVIRKTVQTEINGAAVFQQSLTGVHLIDAATGRELYAQNPDRNYIPASNTKILTLATCLEVLGDSLPGVEYFPIFEEHDYYPPLLAGYCIRGTGDPVFLHPDFQAWQTVYSFLDSAGGIIYQPDRLMDERFGPGWSWDDYPFPYSTERSAMPIYGNRVRLVKARLGWEVQPPAFKTLLDPREDNLVGDKYIFRDEMTDTIRLPYYHEENFSEGFELDIPIRLADARCMGLLDDTLHLGMPIMEGVCEVDWQVKYAVPVDTVYRRMMHQSDNFIAEQLLLVCAGVKFDTLQQWKVINWAMDSLFAGIPNALRWVDGSGLSRYNLISPRFLTTVLRSLYNKQPTARLFSLFPGGGVSGTIKDWYSGPDGKPYIYAKSGSMGGVYCLSGYLIAKSGKVYIFSVMNNNFVGSSTPWKKEMQRIFIEVWSKG